MNWKLNDRWETPLRQIFVVVEILEGGCAMLQMIYPIRTRPAKQKEIPYGWKLKVAKKPKL